MVNFFLLHLDPAQSASYYCPPHVSKMVLESAQLLYSAWGILHPDEEWRNDVPLNDSGGRGYAVTHTKHPVSLWIQHSVANYRFFVEHALAIANEFTARHGTIHSSQKHLVWMRDHEPTNFAFTGLTQAAQAMPDRYKVNPNCGTMQDTIEAYRNYYIGAKLYMCDYTNLPRPEWIPDILLDLASAKLIPADSLRPRRCFSFQSPTEELYRVEVRTEEAQPYLCERHINAEGLLTVRAELLTYNHNHLWQ